MLNMEQTIIALGAGGLVGVLASLPAVQSTGAYTPGIAALGLGAVAGLASRNGGAMTVASYASIGVGALLLVSAYQQSHKQTTAGAFLPFYPVGSMFPQTRPDHA
jgi:hypothetical protein